MKEALEWVKGGNCDQDQTHDRELKRTLKGDWIATKEQEFKDGPRVPMQSVLITGNWAAVRRGATTDALNSKDGSGEPTFHSLPVQRMPRRNAAAL